MNAHAYAITDATESLTNDATQALEQETAAVVVATQALTVSNAETYLDAAERLKTLRAAGKKVESWFKPLVDAAHKAHRELTTRRAETLKPIEAECGRLTTEMSRWKAEEDRKAREEAARLAREEQERQRVLALEEAATLEAQGLTAEAAAVVEEAIVAPAPFIPPTPVVPKADGISHRETWKFAIVDVDLIPREYLTVDEKKLGTVVRALKGSARIPGVRVYQEQTTVVRSA